MVLQVYVISLVIAFTFAEGPSTCTRDFRKIGCFLRSYDVFTDLLITNLDATHKNFSRNIDWDNYAGSLHSLACECRKKAQGHYRYFGIGFYGECMAGKDNAALEAIFKNPATSSMCVNGKMGECNDKNINECAGTEDHDYYYEILEGDCSSKVASGDVLTLFPTQALMKRDQLLTIIPKIGMIYEISLELYPTRYQANWNSVLHMTTDANFAVYGSRIPGIWFFPSTASAKSNKLVICNAIDGSRNHCYYTQMFPLNQWIKIKINQARSKSDYMYSIYVNDKRVYHKTNSRAVYFDAVKVYAGDPWHPAQPGYIRNIKIAENCYDGQLSDNFKLSLPSESLLKRNSQIGRLSKLCKQYSMSLDFKATKYGGSWSSILHVTIGGNYAVYGDRAPGIWFFPSSAHTKSNRFVVSSPVSGSKNYVYSSAYFPLNQWINVKISQRKEGASYIYRVHVNGKEVMKRQNTQPMIFYDLKVFAGDPWHRAQDGYIRNIAIDGGCTGEKHDTNLLQTPLKIQKNLLLTSLLKLTKIYSVQVEVKPTDFLNKWQSVLHMTIGGNYARYGDRAPFIVAYKSIFYICSPVSGYRNYVYATPAPGLANNTWTTIKVSQTKDGADYYHHVFINGIEVRKVKNTQPQEFSNVKVYVADPWHDALPGYIRNLQIEGAVFH